MKPLGRLTRLDPREVWAHEAHEFTPWLLVNIGLLGDALGVDLEEAASEVAAGDFAVDIVARTSGPDPRPVIIENQLEPTDHGHLGQLLTYAAGKNAAIVVWISAKVRDEHRQAIDWLNSISGEGIDFFAVEVEALRIDDSVPAPHFKIVAQPNAWARQTKGQSAAPTERAMRYQRFFEVVLESFKKQRPGLTSASSPGPANWLSFTAGRSGFGFVWSFGDAKGLRVELYIDTADQDRNKALFDALKDRQAELAALGDDLSWERLDHRRASRLATYRTVPAAPPPDENPSLVSWAVETMIRWNDVLRPIITTLVPLPESRPGSGSLEG